MPLLAVGLSHHHVKSEQLAVLEGATTDVVTGLLRDGAGITGAVVLSTCNRFEAYLDVDTFHPAVDVAMSTFGSVLGPDNADVLDAIEVFAGQGAVEHLFSVACGLDSMVVGEPQIAGQVRQALTDADETISPALRRLFQTALTSSKAVATSTDLGAAGRSIATVGLDLVEARHGAVAGKRVLVSGTGSYAGVVVAELGRRGCETIEVYSRTGRAVAFARTHPVAPLGAAALADGLARADLVVACSGGGEPVLTSAALSSARRASEVVLPVLDLSTGRDVAADVNDLVTVDVIGLDDIGAAAPTEHADALLAAQDIVDRGVATFMHLEEGRTAAPAVTAMRAHIMQIIQREVELANRRYPPEVAEAVSRSLVRVSGALLHTPSVRANELARTGELEDYRRAMHTLFGIVVEA